MGQIVGRAFLPCSRAAQPCFFADAKLLPKTLLGRFGQNTLAITVLNNNLKFFEREGAGENLLPKKFSPAKLFSFSLIFWDGVSDGT
ncbi:MAG: hypothetical protein QMD09_14235 [Desulfatibacillaceae bacterium]|nr:hypothetical protein [Desulfatibacillaceae bacterium]